MLGKLIKYEWKASAKLLFITHGFILLFSLLTCWRLFMFDSNHTTGINATTGTAYVYAILLYIVIAVATILGTQLYLALRFHHNLFTDEGYLMFTLPVSPTQLLHSKLITGCILVLFNLLVMGISSILIYYPLITHVLGLGDQFMEGLSLLPISDIAFYAFTFLLGLFAGIIKAYGCICISQLFSKNRFLIIISTYLGCSLLISAASAYLTNYINNKASLAYSMTVSTSNSSSAFVSLNTSTNVISVLFSLLTIVVFYGVSWHIMNRKINMI